MMFLQEIPEDVKTTTLVQIRYDCDGGFERCGKEWTLKHKDAQKNFEKNDEKHICRKCWLNNNNPSKDKKVRDKIKKTNLERYGTTCALNTKENTDARVEKMFGTEEAVKEIVEKRRKTSRKRYGTDHPMQNEEVKSHWEQVLINKYGVRVPLQDPAILKKMQQTNLERYGVTNVASLPDVREKMAKTTLERHGVEFYNQLPEMKDYLRDNCTEWLADSYAAGGPNKGVPRPEEWNQKQRDTVMEAIQNGTWKGGGKHSLRGRINNTKCVKDNPWFRSSYELITHLWLEDAEDVEKYDYEPFKINYTGTDDHSRYYFPDFLVWWTDGRKPTLVEVKNDYTMNAEINLSKNASAVEYTEKNGLDFEVWSNDKIASLKISIRDHHFDKRITIFRGDILKY